jgi:hypothetical protein
MEIMLTRKCQIIGIECPTFAERNTRISKFVPKLVVTVIYLIPQGKLFAGAKGNRTER